MSNYEQVMMAMTIENSLEPVATEQAGVAVDAHSHEHTHDHSSHDHEHTHDHDHESHASNEKLTVRQKMSRWAISKSGIMQNQHVENITAATCCGAVCRGDLPIVAAYLGTTAVAALRTPKDKKSESEE